MKAIVVLMLIAVSFSYSCTANAVLPRSCGERLYVKDSVIIDAQTQDGCTWEIETEKDRILVFTLAEGNLADAHDFFTIHDGLEIDSPVLLSKNQIKYEVSKKDLPPAVYSTKSVASVRFKKTPVSKLQLKIQKAVTCPFNIGAESQCGRVVDEASCYCATFTKRTQPSQKTYCNDNGMKLIALETNEEEVAIKAAWGTSTQFWTALTDSAYEGIWIWETTGANLYPGYANWAQNEPNGCSTDEDCMRMNVNVQFGWSDWTCNSGLDAICENHP